MKAITLLLLSITFLQAEPSSLMDMRKTYESEKKKIDDKYITWLETKAESSIESDKKAYKDEIAKVSGKVEVPLVEEWGKVVTVVSTDRLGYKLGRLKGGDVVKLQYLRGVWRAYTGWKDESPDNATHNAHKLAFVMSTKEGDTVITNPMNTAAEPFTYSIIESGEYYIRIADTVTQSNFGLVQYKVEIK